MNIPGYFANNSKYNIKEWTRGLERIKGEKWLVKGKIQIWCGNRWRCEHNRERSKCKECGGSQICEHNRRRSNCKECGGASICEHNRIRSSCKECGGASICEHNRIRSQCKECGGASICEHNRQKSRCKKCGGASICEHNRIRSRCKECGGSQICEHNRQKSQCIQCGGSQICEHNRIRSQCIQCGGSQICRICKSTRGSANYNKLCVTCAIQQGYTVKRNYKTKELSMVEFITEHTDVDWKNDKAHDLGCSKKRPDMVCDLGSHILIIECDENKHKHGNYSCENKRIMGLSQDFSENDIHRPIVVIRFNPDCYVDSNNQKIESCWKRGEDGILRINNKDDWDLRLNKLLEITLRHMSNQPIKHVYFEYLFYDEMIIRI